MASEVVPPVFHFASFDGAQIAWRELGKGRPLVLIHGLFSNNLVNWIKYGHAQAIAARGFRVIMPDLRAHGDSAKPHDAAAYPSDVLAKDGLALIDHLGLSDYDLGGYSLGARTSVRMALMGAQPRRLVIAGMGLQGLLDAEARGAHFRNVLSNLGKHERGSGAWMAEQFLKTTSGDAKALLPLIDSFVDSAEADLGTLDIETLVVAGEEDDDNGSALALADLLPRAHYVAVPGGHMSAVAKPDLGQAIADFLAPPR